MKFLAAALALAGAAAAQADKYYITDFKADAIPHSVSSNYTFSIGDGSSFPPTECAAQLNSFRQDGIDKLPTVSDGKCGDSQYWTWIAARNADGGINLSVKYTPNSRYSVLYCRQIPAAELQVHQDTPGFYTEHYSGPQGFVVDQDACTKTA